MKIYVKNGNVLDGDEQALCLPIDGAGPGMEGNVARQFAHRWPMLWEEISEEIRFPIPLGGVFEFEVPDEHDDCPFRLILLVSTLHHQQVLDTAGRRAVVRTALCNSIDLLPRYRVSTLALHIAEGRLAHDAG